MVSLSLGKSPESIKAQNENDTLIINKKKEYINSIEREVNKYTNLNDDDILQVRSELTMLKQWLSDAKNITLNELEAYYTSELNSINNLSDSMQIRKNIKKNYESSKKQLSNTSTKEEIKKKYNLSNSDIDKAIKENEILVKLLEKKPYLSKETLIQEQKKVQENVTAIFEKRYKEAEEPVEINAGPLVGTFMTAFFVFLGLSVFLTAGTLTANDSISRPVPFRILNFIYGGLFFIITYIYYAYRWWKGTAPTFYSLLPLTTWQPESPIMKLLFGWFSYVPDENIEFGQQHFKNIQKLKA
jgi:hypothetical protein